MFTDIEGSTQLLQALGERYAGLLADHHRLLREAFTAAGGTLDSTSGDGAYARFPSARDALAATVAAQRALATHDWPAGVSVKVRMGLHTGEPQAGDTGLVGIDIHRAARISAAGHGGQILLSQTTRDLLGDRLPADVRLVDLGEHRLKDLPAPERLFQVEADGLASEFPPLRTVDVRPNNLPRHLSAFVGRGREIGEAKRILATSPLLTLTGPGGVGKTRLAVQVGSELMEQYADGVWLVELGNLSDPTYVVQEIASTLGLGEEPGRPLLRTVTDHLNSRNVLLVLDNCEHVLETAAQAVHTILRASRGCRIVATSLEPLGIEGEALLPVGSLSLPPATAAAAHALTESDAVRLFVDRAAAAMPSFTITDRNAEAVARIVRRLDGIPLALELAAARIRALPVEQIAARLDDRFRLLTGGSRVAVPRHQTLRATMDWSYELLSEDERTVLRRLSVFAGGFNLEAAEAVCATDLVDAGAVFDLVSRLVDRSLVATVESTEEARFGLLETVRAYGSERAAATGEGEDARRRHRDWFLALVERTAPEFFRGPEPRGAIRVLELEHDNVRAALAWSAAAPDEQLRGLRMAAALWRFWETRGYLAEGRGWLERFIAATSDHASLLRANALTGVGILAFIQGDYQAAFAFHEESLALQRQAGVREQVSYAANNLANTAVQLGDLDRARSLYEEGLEWSSETGNRRARAFSLMNLADVVGRQGDYEGARQRYDESVRILGALGDQWGMSLALDNFGSAACRAGDPASARALHEQALGISRSLGDERSAARILGHLGDVAEREGDLAAAREFHLQSLGIRQSVGDLPGIAAALEKLAWAAGRDEAEAAVRLIGCAEALRSSIRAPVPPDLRGDYERHLTELQGRLGSPAFDAARGEGRAMRPEEAVARLLP